MELWIVRHADPDYVRDSITEKGVREAKLLSERLSKVDFNAVYCSPLGRAKKTASYTLEKTKQKPEICDWLQEFRGTVKKGLLKTVCWDRMPSYWTEIDDYYSYDKWCDVKLMKNGNVKKHYDEVCKGIDNLLAVHGYVHNGRLFDVKSSNSDKIILYCHFGVECVILSHIFHMSPMILWHNFAALPTSVTVLATEEREKGKAIFRCLQFGDISHLYAGGEEPSFQARFCEQFSDDTRH